MAKSSVLVAIFLLFCAKGINTVSAKHLSTPQPAYSSVKSCDGEYCDDNDYDDDFWLFWLFIIVAALITSICCGYCCRLRMAQRHRRVLILTGERPGSVTTYGTEVVAPIIVAPHPGYNYNPYINPHGYPQSTLPTYTPVAENKGEPPPYTHQ